MEYGYIRVSSKEQNIDRQLTAIRKENINEENIYIDKSSGKNFDRRSYKKLLEIIKPGDIIYIKSIDRLGRNYDEILKQWNYLTKIKEIDIVVLDLPLLDTRTNETNLTGKFLADTVLQILSYVAQIERENILNRQKEGIIEAHKRGVRFGRPSLTKPTNYSEVANKWQQGRISLRQGAKILKVSHVTFYNWLKKDKIQR